MRVSPLYEVPYINYCDDCKKCLEGSFIQCIKMHFSHPLTLKKGVLAHERTDFNDFAYVRVCYIVVSRDHYFPVLFFILSFGQKPLNNLL